MRIQNHLTTFKHLTGKTFLLLGISACCLVTGCAFSRTETRLQFTPTVNQPLKQDHKEYLAVGEMKDSRPVKDPNVLIHKQNAYGTTSGAYVTKRPVADLVKDGVAEALEKNGFLRTNAAKYELRGDIQEFGLDTMAGFWQATVKPKLNVRFELVDKSSGKSVWHDTLIGRSSGETALGTKEFLSEMFSKAADDLVHQLIANPDFRAFFE
jgi:ABC-type uncharacterized transport system auxiliary subunit